MAMVLCSVNSICRFCLCEDNEILSPVSSVMDTSLNEETIERITGIQLNGKRNISYTICVKCYNNLQSCIVFRTRCLQNDARFRELFPMIFGEIESDNNESTKPSPMEYKENLFANEKLENDSDYSNTYSEDADADDADEISYSETNGNQNLDSVPQTLEPEGSHTYVDANLTDPASCEFPDADRAQTKGKIRRNKQLCVECGKLVLHLAEHTLSHAKLKNFTCSFCSKSYSRNTHLRFHVRSVHQKTAVKTCETCDRTFTYKSGYAAHMRAQHNVGDWYECKVCNLKFRHPGGLRAHNNSKHNDQSKWECTVCGMKFQEKRILKDHSRVHSDERPFACKHCPKRFKGPNALRVHELTHRGVIFYCTLCDKSYRYKTLLTKHLLQCHTELNI